jgi:hypothetical protein
MIRGRVSLCVLGDQWLYDIQKKKLTYEAHPCIMAMNSCLMTAMCQNPLRKPRWEL